MQTVTLSTKFRMLKLFDDEYFYLVENKKYDYI